MVHDGHKDALIVVDVQVGVMAEAWEAGRIVRNIAGVVARAREAGVPVIWVQHSDDELVRGTPEWEFVPELRPGEGEISIHKSFNSAFERTMLNDELARLGINRVVLAGAATNWCIRATSYGALERGYDLILIEDGHTTGSIGLEDGRTIEAEAIVRELNIAMTWVRYPDRVNGTVAAAAIGFGSMG